MTVSYADVLRRYGFAPELRETWAVARHTPRVQGWKLHLSSIPTEAEDLLTTVVPLLRDAGVGFKVARDESVLRQLNEGVLGGTQIGKFITVYPGSDDEARPLAETLAAATRRFHGPAVATDWHLGSVVYTRYGGFNPVIQRDRLGQVSRSIRDADGELRSDEYSVPFRPPDGVANPFAGIAEVTADPAVGNGLGNGKLLGPGFLLFDTLKSDPKGSVFLAVDLRSQESVRKVVLKEGRRHCLSDPHGRDMRSRLRHQQRLHRKLDGKAPVPTAGEYFECGGHGYLPVEYVEGRELGAPRPSVPFSARPAGEARRLLTHLRSLVEAVAALHGCGVVHRDLTLSNVKVLDDDSVRLLDVELAQEVDDPAPPFSQGTPGFMSPQQEAGKAPAPADDVFSLGSILAAVLSGLDPRRLLHAAGDRARVLVEASGVPASLAHAVAACWSADPRQRPGLERLAAELNACASAGGDELAPALVSPASRVSSESDEGPPDRVTPGLLAAAARGLQVDVLRDPDSGLWLSPPIHGGVGGAENRGGEYALYRSSSRGVAGVLYVLARLARVLPAEEVDRAWVGTVVDWLLAHQPTQDDQLPGLHFGEAGVALAIVECVAAGLLEGGRWLEEYLDEALAGPLDWPDVTHGAAGQGLAAIACADLLHDPRFLAPARAAADYLCRLQDDDGGWALPAGVETMEGRRYTGFAHGAAGMIYFLLELGARTGDETANRAWRRGVDWLLAAAEEDPARGALTWPIREGTATAGTGGATVGRASPSPSSPRTPTAARSAGRMRRAAPSPPIPSRRGSRT